MTQKRNFSMENSFEIVVRCLRSSLQKPSFPPSHLLRTPTPILRSIPFSSLSLALSLQQRASGEEPFSSLFKLNRFGAIRSENDFVLKWERVRIEDLAHAISSCFGLLGLEFSYVRINDANAISLMEDALKRNNTLRALHFFQNGFGRAETLRMVRSLEHLRQLRTLTLSKNKIDFNGIVSVARLLGDGYSLRSLDLSGLCNYLLPCESQNQASSFKAYHE
eukprot:TRINITY_DN5214_c0_g2_i8.p1 TRINITY_DN5214_c0_g2~~TRINITY_DN5214_c0_g2_i8.p1  ORF type:complete len:221 (+),score=59.60 TRINITY_DN5214_c0_g2_i8:3-665(+)